MVSCTRSILFVVCWLRSYEYDRCVPEEKKIAWSRGIGMLIDEMACEIGTFQAYLSQNNLKVRNRHPLPEI